VDTVYMFLVVAVFPTLIFNKVV